MSQNTDFGWVSISLEITAEGIDFKIENSKTEAEENQNLQGYKNGIGLKNVKRRLQLIYPDVHRLQILEESDTFWVNLKLPFLS